MGRLISGDNQYGDDAGSPATGCKIYFFESGDMTTPKTTYSDEAMTTANTHPVLADGWGRQPDIWFEGRAWMRVFDADDVLLFEIDPIVAPGSGSGGGGGGDYTDNDVWRWWLASTTFSEDSLVVDPTTQRWYQSRVDDNLNNALTDTDYWTEIGPIYIWDTKREFKVNDFAYYSGLLYRSKVGTNTNNNPITSKTQWEPLGYQFRFNDQGTVENGQTTTLDLLQYNRFKITKASGADITIAFTNEPELGESYVFDIMLVNGAGGFDTITWPANVKMPFNTEPEWSLSGTDIATLVKYPGDTSLHLSLFTKGSA